jgi:ribonuclease VapC
VIVDTSALVAILREEPEGPAFVRAIERTETRRLSAVSYMEAAIVIDSARDPVVSRRFDEFVQIAGLKIEPVTEAQARIARDAYRDFGRGSGHPAKLNFGDCFSYALARSRGEPLLFKGEDFVHTDVARAITSDRK